MIDLQTLITETRNKDTYSLDLMTPFEIAQALNNEDKKVPEAVTLVLPQIAIAIEWCTDALKNGGRIIYMGAGTSGRLGLLDAVECPPTFGVPSDLVVGLIAGGAKAFIKAVEGAEDSEILGEIDLRALNICDKDIVIGLAASGRTPYVIHGLRFARTIGCNTIAIACNKDSLISKEAKLAIEPIVGPEALTGSTRLKAGTAQKLILNMISTGSMIRMGKTYENLMVDLMQTNEKLIVRSQNIVMTVTQCNRKNATEALINAKGSVKLAIVMILFSCSLEDAKTKLEKADGHIRKCN